VTRGVWRGKWWPSSSTMLIGAKPYFPVLMK
jgi:hypothetical protein